jgi:tripeptide aminopeptidase
VKWDGSRDRTGSDTDNLIAHLPAINAERDPLFFCAHLDTVAETEGIETVIDDGWVRTDGRTILGADDKAGIAVAMEAVRRVRELGVPHGGIDLVFTVAEEVGLLGARELDTALVAAKKGFVLDSGSPVGTVVVRTPAQVDFEIVVKGKPAHAGVEPEKGINAIAIAARALAPLPWGRLDKETTANIGTIDGGQRTNIVADKVVVTGEVRARSEARLRGIASDVEKSFEAEAAASGAQVEVQIKEGFPLLDIDETSAFCAATREAVGRLGLEHAFVARGGGSDANVLNRRGLNCLNLGLAMVDDHSRTERIRVKDLVSAAQLLIELVEVTSRRD